MKKGVFSSVLAVVLTAAVFALPIANAQLTKPDETSANINKSSTVITPEKKESSAADVPTAPKSDQTVTFIVTVEGDSLLDTLLSLNNKYDGIADFLLSSESKQYCDAIKKNQAVVKASIKRIIPQTSFDNCFTYNTVLNGFTVTAPYSCLDKLKKIDGVESVVLSASTQTRISFDDENIISEEQSFSKSALNMDTVYESDYSGKNMLIAVIDDSFDCGNIVFANQPDSAKYDYSDIEKILSAVSFSAEGQTADIYKNGKIVFAYDYADRDSDTSCSAMTHGTRTAGVAAGNNALEGEQAYRGTAFDSQLALMKVSADVGGNISDEAVLAALDDAAKLSPDVINCSFGVPRAYPSSVVFDRVYNKLYESGIYITAAAGNNSYNSSAVSQNNLNYDFVDYGTVSYPASLSSVTAVGSVNSGEHKSYYFTANDSQEIEYSDILLDTEGVLSESEFSFDKLISENSDYIYIDSFGEIEDYWDMSAGGKIVVVNRGGLTFTEKIKNAYMYNTLGIIIINSEEEDYKASAEDIQIPSIIIPEKYKSYFEDNPEGTISPSSEKKVFDYSASGKISSFSSYGVTSDLRLKPEVCAPGTNVYSAFGSESFSSVNGTSMSSAYIAGAAAVIKQYLKSSDIMSGAYNIYKNKLISAVLMNNAQTIKYEDSDLYYTPRVQGAGTADVFEAVNADTYIVVGSNSSAKADIGDSTVGEYSFDFTLYNNSQEKRDYDISHVIQTDRPEQSENGIFINTLEPLSLADYADITFSVEDNQIDIIEAEAYSSVNVVVNIKLDPSYVLASKDYFPNGFYVDGYLFIGGEENSLTVPFMGFCGDWSKLPIFDDSTDDNRKVIIGSDDHLAAVAEFGHTYPKYELGKNIFTGEYNSENIYISSETMKSFLDTNLIGTTFILPDCSLLRDAFNYTIDISDHNGKSILKKNYGILSAFISNDTEPYLNLLSSINVDDLKNLFAGLSEGSYTYTVSADTMTSDGKPDSTKSLSYDFIVDNTKPKADSPKTYTKDGKIYLELTAYDSSGIQGFILNTAVKDSQGKYNYADSLDELIKNDVLSVESYTLVSAEEIENGKVRYTYDITNLRQQLLRLGAKTEDYIEKPTELKIIFRAVDYAYNLSSPKTADTVAYGEAEISFVDRNDKPVSDVAVKYDDKEKISQSDGKVIFDGIMPGIYTAYITNLPDNYEVQTSNIFIYTNNDSINFKTKIVLDYTGEESSEIESEISESSLQEDESSQQSELSEVSQNSKENSNASAEYAEDSENIDGSATGDDSFYAFIFVGTLLLISVASLMLSRFRLNKFHKNY